MKTAQLERLYGQTARELKSDLRAIDLERFSAEKAETIKRKARRMVTLLNLAGKAWIDTELVRAYSLGARRARVALEILGAKSKRQPLSKAGMMREKTLETLVRSNGSINKTVDSFLEISLLAAHALRSAKVQEFDRQAAYQQYEELGREAMIGEASRGELAKKIRDFLMGQIENEDFIEINGRFYNMRKYSQLVARTEMRNAQTEATLNLCSEYENDLVEVSDHATDCELCDEYEGNTYSISGRDAEYPLLDESPPFHPNCKHSLLPTSRLAIEARRRFG